MKQIVCVYIDQELKQYLEQKARKEGLTLSELIRRILIENIVSDSTIIEDVANT
jgi:antitoxin component of RelBE/YafQ-DinJ toxin-antitoxin module